MIQWLGTSGWALPGNGHGRLTQSRRFVPGGQVNLARWVPLRTERKALRRKIELPCQVVRESDFALMSEHALDLSERGMLLRQTSNQARTGDALIVSFCATQLSIWFDLEAVVTRIISGRRRYDRGPAIGVEFTNITPLQRMLIRGAITKAPLVVSQRKPVERTI